MKTIRKLALVLCLLCVAGLPLERALPARLRLMPAAQAAAKLRMNQKRIGLAVGETYRLRVKGTSKKVRWKSSDPAVAKVNGKGMVTALAEGEAVVTAKVGRKKLTCRVTVFSVVPFPSLPPDVVVVKKPILYLYPEAETELTVTLGQPERLTASYPAYRDGWHVSARPDGTLTDLSTGRKLYALYWEGMREAAPELPDGFVVPGRDAAAFLEEKLSLLGLNEREAEEFILYWLPRLEASPWNLIRFEDRAAIDAEMPLAFSTQPDALIRVWMVFKPLGQPVDLPEQVLPEAPIRQGFTAVEWGGMELE